MQNMQEPFFIHRVCTRYALEILTGALARIFWLVDQNKSFSDLTSASAGDHVTDSGSAEVSCSPSLFFSSVANSETVMSCSRLVYSS